MVTQVGIHKFAAASEPRRDPDPVAPDATSRTESSAATAARPVKPEAVLGAAVPELDSEALESAVKTISEAVQVRQRTLQFTVDEDSGRTIITVIDKETEEIIRQIPPEEVLALHEFFRPNGGLLVNTEA